ncbi:unnamed protein product [Plutella xylostella]|uniref:(diamondback moth) hypothetical protein n=1 Tax=Plutella xylostella TaxID=51655 RepID=A0A8S4FYF5_PLUXY|nr:unnamed protein product [Plutella xylostella]
MLDHPSLKSPTMFVFCVLAVSVTKFDFASGAAVDRPDTNKDLVLAFVGSWKFHQYQ